MNHRNQSASRRWHKPQRSEVKPTVNYWDNLVTAFGLAILIVAVRLWRLLTYGENRNATP